MAVKRWYSLLLAVECWYALVQGSDQCDACRHVQVGPKCEAECPSSTYADSAQICRPCHPNCLRGCTGSANSLGQGGCNACDVVVYEPDSDSYCLNPLSNCPDDFFPKYARDSSTGSRYVVRTGFFYRHRQLSYWHCLRSVQSMVCASIRRPSVCLSCPFRPLHAAAAGLLLWAQQPGDISLLLHGRRSAAAMPHHGAQQQMRAVPRYQQM